MPTEEKPMHIIGQQLPSPIDRYLYKHVLGPHLSWPAGHKSHIVVKQEDWPKVKPYVKRVTRSIQSWN